VSWKETDSTTNDRIECVSTCEENDSKAEREDVCACVCVCVCVEEEEGEETRE
jgi:hypothetical protein